MTPRASVGKATALTNPGLPDVVTVSARAHELVHGDLDAGWSFRGRTMLVSHGIYYTLGLWGVEGLGDPCFTVEIVYLVLAPHLVKAKSVIKLEIVGQGVDKAISRYFVCMFADNFSNLVDVHGVSRILAPPHSSQTLLVGCSVSGDGHQPVPLQSVHCILAALPSALAMAA